MQTLCPHPRDTHMRCLANNLNYVARSVAYICLIFKQTGDRTQDIFHRELFPLLMIQEDQVASYLYKNEQK